MLVPADVDLLLLSTPATSRSIISETLVTSLLVLLLVDTSENVAYVDVSNNGSNDIMISYTDGGKTHYAIVNVTLGLNTKAKDYASKSTTINNGMKVIVNAVQTEAMKYTYSTIAASKTTVESNLLATLQDTFQTECITSVIVSVVVQ